MPRTLARRHCAAAPGVKMTSTANLWSGKSVLVTGGTGSFGQAFVKYALDQLGCERIIVFSRDELKQSEMRKSLGDDQRLRWFLGDVRDLERLRLAFHGINYVIHAAALKQVDTVEYNPTEAVRTNIAGAENVIRAAMDSGVSKVLALSTDKASSPINLYGATKLVSDKLFVAANSYGHGYGTAFSVVRYGNVMGSRGSVVPLYQRLAREGTPIPITDERMTRFWISLRQAVQFVTSAVDDMMGGELFVPMIPSVRITDLVEAIAPTSETLRIGIRPGEKLHEEMVASDDSRRTVKQHDRFVVLPVVRSWATCAIPGEPVPEGFSYRSDTNADFLSVDQIRRLCAED